ncbi:histidinol dehydrogenase [Aspergillus affinis]|uniref:histidinol dehydrogenase n=1 Tax=Aspergillus affinis TaxID=1070780 RepID=UPI0022FE2B7C|nr:histidinol dehydrogenase [Aspergillus affinis]KAI9042800.1 histidinol dehydrogenase [Aspergillus affinis]
MKYFTDVKNEIRERQANVQKFATSQPKSINDFEIEMAPGVHLGQKNIPISSNVVGCTPPIAREIPNATVAAVHYAGADQIYILGGVQTVAGMAIGTESILKVDFIAGPGNAFVAEAKRQLFDDAADPFTVATDLLSQAEHGLDSLVVQITTSEDVANKTMRYIDQLLKNLETARLAGESWKNHGEVVVVDNLDEAYKLAGEYAHEHVQILTRNPRDVLEKIQHYGALFLGEKTCVSYEEQVIGTNHVLPTRKAARYTGGLWVGKFLRTVIYQEITSDEASGKLGQLCGRAARTENFEGHARSGDLRAHKYLNDEYRWIKQGLSRPQHNL